MLPEVFFLKYAYPCSFIIRQRGEINDEDMENLRQAAIKSVPYPREKLEKIFFRAFQKITPIAKRMNKDKWDIAVLREYFINEHNDIIEKGMYSYAQAPQTLKNLCKVHKAKVIEKNKDILIVEYDNDKIRPVLSELVPEAKVNDLVAIHYGYAVEKIEDVN